MFERTLGMAALLWLLSGFGLFGMNLVYVRAYRMAAVMQAAWWGWLLWGWWLDGATESRDAFAIVLQVLALAALPLSALSSFVSLQAAKEAREAGEQEVVSVRWAGLFWLLSGFGMLGGHRVYLGKPVAGAVTLVLFWGVVLLDGAEFVRILVGVGLMLYGLVEGAMLGEETMMVNRRLASASATVAVRSMQASGISARAQAVCRVCLEYAGFRGSGNCWVGDDIPLDRLERARRLYPPPGGGKVLAMVDTGGRGEYGLLIAEDGVSWRNNWTTSTDVTSWTWEAMQAAGIQAEGQLLRIGDGRGFDAREPWLAHMLRRIFLGICAAVEGTERTPADGRPAPQAATASEREPTPPPRPRPSPPRPRPSPPRPLDVSVVTPAPRPTPAPASARGQVDANTARVEALACLPGIGVAQAHRIVQRRTAQSFTSLEELGDFLNLKPHHMQRLRGRLAFTAPQAEVSAPPPPRSEETPRGRRGRVID